MAEAGSSATTLKTEPAGGAASISHATACLEPLANSLPPSPTDGPLLKSAHGVKTTSRDLPSSETASEKAPPPRSLVNPDVSSQTLSVAKPLMAAASATAMCQRYAFVASKPAASADFVPSEERSTTVVSTVSPPVMVTPVAPPAVTES